MSYTAPTITASGGTWAEFKTYGFAGQIEAVIAANSFNQAVINEIRAFRKGNSGLKIADINSAMNNYLHGLPVATADINTQLLNHATAVAALLTAINEANTLIAANPGTLTTTVNPALSGLQTVRVLP